MKPQLSAHFTARKPSDIRKAQILFAARPDRERVRVVNVAIGNVSLPMHPALRSRLEGLASKGSPFHDGVVRYAPTIGTEEAQQAFLNIIASAGCATGGLHTIVTDGGSQAMELVVLGVCGPASGRPLLLLDPAYTNYRDMASRAAVHTVAVPRVLEDDGTFAAPDLKALEVAIREHRPPALVLIPADNPTGQYLRQEDLAAVARLATQYNLWLVSDEAYRQLHYTGGPPSSIWALDEADVPGIRGRRITIETASKVWNGCGLRIGALVTDSPEFHGRALAEYTANLCANSIGQYLFGALAHVSHESLAEWYDEQRAYYAPMMRSVADGLRAALPGLIVSRPDAALYSVLDVRDIAWDGFDAGEFVTWCAEEGKVTIAGEAHTLLVAPLRGFYDRGGSGPHPGDTQMRIAFVESPEQMALVPKLFAALYAEYRGRAGQERS